MQVQHFRFDYDPLDRASICIWYITYREMWKAFQMAYCLTALETYIDFRLKFQEFPVEVFSTSRC